MSAPVAQSKVDATVVLLLSDSSATWRTVVKELGFTETVAKRALTKARGIVAKNAEEVREIVEVDLVEVVRSLTPAYATEARHLVAMLQAKRAEIFDVETGELVQHPIYGKDEEGEKVVIGYTTASMSEIKSFIDAWKSAWTKLESVTGLDVQKKQRVAAAKQPDQQLHLHGEGAVSAAMSNPDRKRQLEEKLLAAGVTV